MLCANIGVLFDPNQSDVQVETEFADPPGLETLGGLLTVLTAVSSKYKLYPVGICLPASGSIITY